MAGTYSAGAPAFELSFYEGYGALRQNVQVASGATTTPRDPVGFGGQFGYYTDTETGLLCLTHRYYDPGTGKFINRDPIGYAGGQNLYAFCEGNPVNESDPNGTLSPNQPTVDPLNPTIERVLVKAGRLWRILIRPVAARAIVVNPVTMSVGLFFMSQTRLADDSMGPVWAAEKRKRDASAATQSIPQGGTYILRDPVSGKVMRTGMAANLGKRKSDHKKSYPNLIFEIDRRSSSRDARRGREQIIHDLYNPPLDVQNPIKRKNYTDEQYQRMMDAGRKL